MKNLLTMMVVILAVSLIAGESILKRKDIGTISVKVGMHRDQWDALTAQQKFDMFQLVSATNVAHITLLDAKRSKDKLIQLHKEAKANYDKAYTTAKAIEDNRIENLYDKLDALHFIMMAELIKLQMSELYLRDDYNYEVK